MHLGEREGLLPLAAGFKKILCSQQTSVLFVKKDIYHEYYSSWHSFLLSLPLLSYETAKKW